MDDLPVSVVITVKNEEKNIKQLMESLMLQEKPFEVIVVDAESQDRTVEILKSYLKSIDLKIIVKKCTRGAGRNIGVEHSKYDFVIFTDGDVILDSKWISEMRKSFLNGYDVVAGKTITIGDKRFVGLDRVELYFKNYDVTFPSCNLGYKKEIFKKIGGFDERFITAEDIDLNFRAINEGAKFHYNENAIVYSKVKNDIQSFLKQAFWNGYGRGQLTKKHGNLWKNYSLKNIFSKKQLTLFGTIRLIFGLSGYLYAKITFRT